METTGDYQLWRVDPGESADALSGQAFTLEPTPRESRKNLSSVTLGIKLARQLEVVEDAIRCLENVHGGRSSLPV